MMQAAWWELCDGTEHLPAARGELRWVRAFCTLLGGCAALSEQRAANDITAEPAHESAAPSKKLPRRRGRAGGVGSKTCQRRPRT